MAVSITTVRLSDDVVLPIKVFVNRKKLLYNNTKQPIIQAPVLSNNSIVCLKSPATMIYLSEKDMSSLCEELKNDILLLVYELTSKEVMEQELGKLRIDKSIQFQTSIVMKNWTDQQTKKPLVTSNIDTLTRISKHKYKLHFKNNWEVDIFINDIRTLAELRNFMLFNQNLQNTSSVSMNFSSDKKVIITETEQDHPKMQTPVILQEEEEFVEIADVKPTFKVNYKPVLSCSNILDIHVLQRPKRHNN